MDVFDLEVMISEARREMRCEGEKDNPRIVVEVEDGEDYRDIEELEVDDEGDIVVKLGKPGSGSA